MGAELAKAKLQVMAAVPYVQKGHSPGLKYTFAGEAAFIEKLHPAMVAAGLEIAPSDMEVLHQEVYSTSSGAKMNRILVKVRYTLTHAGSGESQVITTIGEGSDSGDKATNKGMTAAYKYALRQAFLIETGNDPDETPSEHQQRATRGRPNFTGPPQQPRPQTPPANGNGTAALKPLSARDLSAKWAGTPLHPENFADAVKRMDARLCLLPGYSQGDFIAAIRDQCGAEPPADAQGVQHGREVGQSYLDRFAQAAGVKS